MQKKSMIGATVLAALIPVGAFASFTLGEQVGTSLDEIRSQLEGKGYTVMEIEVEDGEIEVEYQADGQIYEMEIAESTGQVIGIELEDEDGDD